MATPTTWQTGLCSCCAEPGGCGLCCRASLCPCTVVGDINTHVNGPGGFLGGCLCTLCGFSPCFMCFIAPQVAEKTGFTESGIKALCCTICCGCCYIMQVQRECALQQQKGVGAPMQQEMK
mmetsp:Transcript_64042/g.111593  ORF Transcript_64042/g.111593 Transcript_64042/m.111593 type:complete len:121 (-) Transcript_64042:108-470(-)